MDFEQQIKKEIAQLANREKVTYAIEISSFKPNTFLNDGQSIMFYFKLLVYKSDHKFEMFYDPIHDDIILRSIEIPAIFMASSKYESVSELFNFVMN